VLDKKAGHLIKGMIYPMPPEKTGGIGIHLTPTIGGNIIIGPSAEYIDCKTDLGTTYCGMQELFEGAVKLVPELNQKHIIHEYSGLRSKLIKPGSVNEGDFVIEENPSGFIHLLGIESPGLTAAPVLAEKVRDLIGRHERLQKNSKFNPKRKRRIRFSELSRDEKARLIKENSDYGVLVCRCEEVSKKEVLDALNNPLGVRTLKGIRIRARAGMGRCQGSFCIPKIMELVGELDFTLKGRGSRICSCKLRE
jgi:glycerol-3-phosphate dehydrogenase